MITDAQKRANKNYRARLKEKRGLTQKAFFITDTEDKILKAVLGALRMIDPSELDQVKGLDLSDDFHTITLLRG
jgi:hypothetical protein